MSDTSTADAEAVAPAPRSRKPSFPAPVTFLAAVLVLVWLAAFFIPSGEYARDATGSPIPGTYQQVPSPQDFGDRIADLLLAPINGLYGIQDPETGQIGPFNTGRLFGGVDVFFFILAIGAFMTVVTETGALGLGIHHLAHRFRSRGPVLIIVLGVLFGSLGSIMSWSDETLGLYAIMIPLFVALGYDRLVVVAVVTVTPTVGVLASTINPFVTGIGSNEAGVTIGEGMWLRLLMLALTMTATIGYTLWYARRVQADPARSICGVTAEDGALREADSGPPPPLTGRHAAVIALVALTFALLTFSIIPWGAILDNKIVDPYTHETVASDFAWELGWWLPELSALFLVMAVVIGVVGGLAEADLARAFIKGVVDFTGPAFLVTLARGVSVVMTNTQTIDTVLFAMEGFVAGASSVVFVLLTFLGTLPLSFLVGGGAAGTALVMPVLAPLGDFAGLDRALIITVWQSAAGWLRLILPINVILMAGLAMAGVGFDQYLRFMAPLMIVLLVIVLGVLVLGTVL